MSENMTEQQAAFEGWAILEIFGHQTFAGYVKTEYYGAACMFRLDVPPLPERERVTKSGCRAQTPEDPNVHAWCPPSSTVKEPATEGYTKMFGVGAIQPRALMVVSLAAKALPAPDEDDSTDDSDMCLDCSQPMELCRCQ